MRERIEQPALLPNLGGIHLPPLALSVPDELQFCVDTGAGAAACFFDDVTVVGLHDHIAACMQAFLHSLDGAIAQETAPTRQWMIERMQRCVDAFGAGYLGRTQQELRLFHDGPATRTSTGTARHSYVVN